jgi:hypothetical protein
MIKSHRKMIFTTVALAAVLAVASYAFADWGRGWGHRGYGPHHQGIMEYGAGPGAQGGEFYCGSGPGTGAGRSGLSDEQLERIEQQRQSFFTETEPLRQKLYEKKMALRSELAKENPDLGSAKQLQGEISDLRAEFDQKRLEHRIEMRKIAPESGGAAMGRGGRSPRGGGYGSAHGYGRGPCWR